MIYVLHGIAGQDNHSAVLGAVEAESLGVVQQALKKFAQTYPESVGQINRMMFNEFSRHSGLQIVPVVSINVNIPVV